MRTVHGPLLVAGVFAFALVACQLIAGVEDEAGALRPTSNGTETDASVGDAAPLPDPCVKRRPPEGTPNPLADTDGMQVLLAIRSVSIHPRGEPPLGYDLDGHCTGDPTSTTSDSPCVPYATTDVIADDEAGVDNLFGRLIGLNPFGDGGAGSDIAAGAINGEIDDGALTMMILVGGYNGQANDEYVKVAILGSPGMDTESGCRASDADDGGVEAGPEQEPRSKPRWDGCDSWSYVNGAAVFNGVPSDVRGGFVRDNTLVAALETAVFSLGSNDFVLQEGWLTAHVEAVGGDRRKLRLTNGLIVGRAMASDLVSFSMRFNNDGVPLCSQAGREGFVELVRNRICEARDIPRSRADDDKGLACSGISMAVGFVAEPVKLGSARAPLPLTCPEFDASCPPATP